MSRDDAAGRICMLSSYAVFLERERSENDEALGHRSARHLDLVFAQKSIPRPRYRRAEALTKASTSDIAVVSVKGPPDFCLARGFARFENRSDH